MYTVCVGQDKMRGFCFSRHALLQLDIIVNKAPIVLGIPRTVLTDGVGFQCNGGFVMDWIYHAVECSVCGRELQRRLYRPKDGARIRNFFCDNVCKGTWQRARREALGWTEEWLRQKYLVEGLSCNEIANIVRRNPKQVWQWIKDYGISTRPRGHNTLHLPRGRKPGFRLSKKHKERLREARKESPNLPHLTGGKHWLKTVPKSKHPNWKGGISPERQVVYETQEWKDACKAVWSRANAHCERCGKNHNTVRVRSAFHIHHIVGFENVELRVNPLNLMLVCRECHLWIHSNKNKSKEFIGREERCRIRGKL